MPNAPVYLIGSGQGGTFAAGVKRALSAVHGRKARVAASYAAMDGNARGLSFMISTAAKIFGVEVERFAVPGERGASSDKDARQTLDDADLVFMAGGDPVSGARLFAESGADAWLREANARGVPMIGISAGAMMLCAYWASWPEQAPVGAPFDGGELVRCTGVVSDLVIDCHAEEDGWSELSLVQAMLAAEKRSMRLRGVPSGGGLIVHPDGRLEAFGKEAFDPEANR
jgi:cyanophycinase-like exopeptidase